jgi:hypothetical protein
MLYDLYSPVRSVLDACGSRCIKELNRPARTAPPPLQSLLEIKRKLYGYAPRVYKKCIDSCHSPDDTMARG